MRHLLLLLLAAAILLAASPPARPSAAAGPLPAPVGGPAPTLRLEPARGYAGQPVRVSGRGVAPSPGVRVAWLLADATYTAALAPLGADGAYAAELTVPPEAALGVARVCAAPTGSESAAFACADFTVEAPPPAGLDITLPADLLPPAAALAGPALAAIEPMRLSLLDMGGASVASALVGPGGRVQIADVPPGIYQASVTGAVGQPFDLGLISLDAGQIQSHVPVGRLTSRFDPVTQKPCTNDEARVASVRAQFADGATFAPAPPSPGQPPSDMRARSSARTARLTFYDPSKPFVQPPLGWFISGVRLDNQLQVRVQERYLRSVASVAVYVRPADSGSWQRIRTVARGANNAFELTYNVGDLPPGTSEVAFAPVMPGSILAPGPVQCAQRVPVNVSPDPTVGGSISGATVWNPAGYYTFSGTMAGGPGLPSVVADPQYQNGSRNMGDLSSSQNVPMQVSGRVALDRVVTLNAWQSSPSAQLFGQGTASGSRPMTQPGATGFVGLDPRNASFSYGPQTLWKDYKRIKFFEGVVFSYFGIVNVKVGAGVFFGGQVSFNATIYPLQPQFDSRLDSQVVAGGYVSIGADLLGGLVEGGVNIGVGVSLSLPLSVSVGQRNEVALRNECVKIYGYLTVYWSAVWGIFGDESAPVRLFDVYAPRGCTPLPLLPFAQPPVLATAEFGAPRVMPQPAAASGAGGRMIALAIEDATPDALSASPRVVARAWDATAQAWGAPLPLSDGARLVDRPTVAFYGDGTRAVAAWAQLDLSATESAGGMPFAQQVRHMEIYAATYDGASWGAAQRVTSDLLIDARPSLAGTLRGVTLAWVRDTDGDTATRDDSHIAVARWDGAWGPVELLGGGVSQPGTTVPFGRGAAVLDGNCGADEYQSASHFQFPDAGGGTSDLWLRHDGSDLLLCVRGVAGSLPQRAYNLRLDPQDARAALAQTIDIQISAPLDGSAPSAQIGNGGGSYVDSPDILGWQAAVASGTADSAEFRLPLSLIGGGVCDRSFGLNVAHTWVSAVGDDYHWRPGSVWNSPQTWGRAVIECPGENTQPSAAAAEVGSLAGGDYSARVGLAWTYDADGDALTPADRRLALASSTSSSPEIWRSVAPEGLPVGAQTPSVAVAATLGTSPDTLLLSFATPFIDRAGQMVAASDQGEVWTGEAYDNDGAWTTASRRLTDAADAPLHGERPQMWAGPGGEALVLFRRFGEGSSTATLGQLALVQARRDGAGAVSSYSPPRYLTGDFAQHWQPALAVSRATGELVAMSGALPPAASPAEAARLRPFLTDEPAPPSAPAGPGGLTLSRLAAGPDPALTPTLALSQAHAPIGTTVTITATVTNLGRGPVEPPAQLLFYVGKPGAGGDPISAYEVGPLAFGDSQEFTLSLTADGSTQPVYAEVTAAGDTVKDNNVATAELGALPAPRILSAAPSQLWPGSVEVSLAAAPADGAAGYRIYRRMGTTGGYELVGETAGVRLYDLLAPAGQAPCYVARSFDSAGTLSPPSDAVCATTVGQVVYLPLVRR